MSTEWLGIIGGVCLAISSIPQVIKTIKDGHAEGLATGSIWLWLVGCLAMLFYVIVEHQRDVVLVLNYFISVLFVFVILWYKYRPHKKS